MFKEQYHKDNEKISPDKALVHHLSSKMKDASNESFSYRLNRRAARGITAVVACAALLICGAGIVDLVLKSPAKTGMDMPASPAALTPVQQPETYESIYLTVKDKLQSYFTVAATNGKEETDNAVNEMNFTKAPGAADDSVGVDFSSTNTQVNGVDEADVIKTDGKYIYALTEEHIVIIEVNGAEMKETARISRNVRRQTEDRYKTNEYQKQAVDLYIKDDLMVVVNSIHDYSSVYSSGDVTKGSYDDFVYSHFSKISVSSSIYDITDRSNPVFISESGQSGNYISSRMVGNVLYMISNDYSFPEPASDKPETFIPSLYRDENAFVMSADDVAIAENPQSLQYVVITSLDIENPGQYISSKSVLGCGANIYANTSNLLIAAHGGEIRTKIAQDGDNDIYSCTESTDLINMSLDNGKIGAPKTGNIPGSLLNQFSMDEYNGYFRVVTTAYKYYHSGQKTSAANDDIISSMWNNSDSTNALYTLDENLDIVGKIEDVAKGERVYSVRFDGDIGYFVTFRQVDPLFTVDLSDPAAPVIKSALKIPGFSEYLHPYSNGLLFGFGKDVNESSGWVEGLKLSMFDVSNPSDVTEKQTLILNKYNWSGASYNHKAILVSPDRGLIAFHADNKYVIFNYSTESGFTQRAEIDLGNAYGYSDFTRGLYIGNTFYVFNERHLNAYSMDNYARLSGIVL